jgi:hypothetical protein
MSDTPLPPGGSTPAASAIMGDYALLQRHMLEILPVVYDPVVGSRTSEPRRTTSFYWWPATRRKSSALATPFYMHVGGHGDPIKLATALRAALAESKTPLEASAVAAAPAVELDSEQLDQIVGVKGKENGVRAGYRERMGEQIIVTGKLHWIIYLPAIVCVGSPVICCFRSWVP